VCSAPGICATEHDIRVQQQQAFQSVTVLHLRTSKTTDETAYISHKTVCHIKRQLVSTCFVEIRSYENQIKVSCHRRQHHQMTTMNVTGSGASVCITVMTTATRALCILPPSFFFFFCSFTDIVFSVIKVQCAFRIKNDNNFKSNSNRQNYSTIWPLPFYEDFSRSPLHPPKFQLHSMGSQRSLRYHTFSQNFHV
jgi:hypothetical protein